MYKYCPECGNPLVGNEKFCPHCGTPVNSVSNRTLFENPTANDGSAPGGNHTLIDRPYQSGQPTLINKPKKSKTGIWFWIGFLIPIGIGAAIWIPIYQHNEKIKAEQLAKIQKHRRDSVAAVKAELARLEQQRQDSIKDEEAHRIHPKMFKYGDSSKLKSLGFKKVDEKYVYSDYGPDEEYIKYERVFNGRKIIYEYWAEGSSGSYLTFEDKGDKDLFLKEMKWMGYKKSGNSYEHSNYEYPPMYLEGNKIFISTDY